MNDETPVERAERLGLSMPKVAARVRELPPDTYARVFEGHPEGAAVLAELTARFYSAVSPEGGIDAIVRMMHANGQRAVIEFIVSRINQAHAGR
jgi:hypothetical protein